jgi:hypothetical protein
MIEAAPKTTAKLYSDSAELYMWTCTHNNKYDWRFPTTSECEELGITGCWHVSDFNYTITYSWKVTPVRTKDD